MNTDEHGWTRMTVAVVFTRNLIAGPNVAPGRKLIATEYQSQPNLANALGLDADVAEAAGLAHDLGHPPFGHIAEEKLNELVAETGIDGYEGNAQTFRILGALSSGDAAPEGREFIPGLNLTRATLNAVLKYPWRVGENPEKPNKWRSYNIDRDVFEWVREGSIGQTRSVEADIMDWADDVSYAVHDMVDFYCAGLVPLHLLAAHAGPSGGDLAKHERDKFFEAVCARKSNKRISTQRNKFEAALSSVMGLASFLEPFSGSAEQTADVWRFSSELIDQLVGAIKLVPNTQAAPG